MSTAQKEVSIQLIKSAAGVIIWIIVLCAIVLHIMRVGGIGYICP